MAQYHPLNDEQLLASVRKDIQRGDHKPRYLKDLIKFEQEILHSMEEARDEANGVPPFEAAIVWLEDIERLDYVREIHDSLCNFRERKPKWWARGNNGRMVGYSTLKPYAPSPDRDAFFTRRIFWLAAHDRDSGHPCYRPSVTPCEAVDPRTVKPGVKGVLTDRARNGAVQ